jgi:hypothetical protein
MLNRDFKEFAELLNANGVEYLLNKRASGRAKDLADLEALDPPEQSS